MWPNRTALSKSYFLNIFLNCGIVVSLRSEFLSIAVQMNFSSRNDLLEKLDAYSNTLAITQTLYRTFFGLSAKGEKLYFLLHEFHDFSQQRAKIIS